MTKTVDYFYFESPCIEWGGKLDRDGYGKTSKGGKSYLAHRLRWIEANGPIPDGMTVNHLCWNRSCVNVSHMNLLSAKENARRQIHSLSGVCKIGHILSDENVYVWSLTGRRYCAECSKKYSREYIMKKKQEAVK